MIYYNTSDILISHNLNLVICSILLNSNVCMINLSKVSLVSSQVYKTGAISALHQPHSTVRFENKHCHLKKYITMF